MKDFATREVIRIIIARSLLLIKVPLLLIAVPVIIVIYLADSLGCCTDRQDPQWKLCLQPQ